ncbi:hypothetical protein ACCO45_006148 [Purpureocillium lilacinum]|uniref:Uncharacterized protein n=1 Tax=Purpureocillium lilacinum TaxID=33203 RepID=A0ACC4E014_PURLI
MKLSPAIAVVASGCFYVPSVVAQSSSEIGFCSVGQKGCFLTSSNRWVNCRRDAPCTVSGYKCRVYYGESFAYCA